MLDISKPLIGYPINERLHPGNVFLDESDGIEVEI
jgi:hypothetical protein